MFKYCLGLFKKNNKINILKELNNDLINEICSHLSYIEILTLKVAYPPIRHKISPYYSAENTLKRGLVRIFGNDTEKLLKEVNTDSYMLLVGNHIINILAKKHYIVWSAMKKFNEQDLSIYILLDNIYHDKDKTAKIVAKYMEDEPYVAYNNKYIRKRLFGSHNKHMIEGLMKRFNEYNFIIFYKNGKVYIDKTTFRLLIYKRAYITYKHDKDVECHKNFIRICGLYNIKVKIDDYRGEY